MKQSVDSKKFKKCFDRIYKDLTEKKPFILAKKDKSFTLKKKHIKQLMKKYGPK